MCEVVLIVSNVNLQKILRLSLYLGLRNYGLHTNIQNKLHPKRKHMENRNQLATFL